MNLHQHFVRADALAGLFAPLNLRHKQILEFGAGTGVLTMALLEMDVGQLVAWELDQTLVAPVCDKRLTWVHRDILSATCGDVHGKAIVAFPPYTTLGFILDLCTTVDDCILMVPTKRVRLCVMQGFQELTVLDGSAFTPASTGLHHIMVKGCR